jgi:hypothetical protein
VPSARRRASLGGSAGVALRAFRGLDVQRHQPESVSGGVDISDAHQFDNGVMGVDHCFDVVRCNEVFVTVEAEVGYAGTGHDGCIGSSSPSDATSDERITGWRTLCAGSPICSLTGAFCMGAAEQLEPDEARASRPVLLR